MAHFANLENGRVTQVVVIDNKELLDENSIEQESKGVEFCKTLFGQDTTWIQTSYNSNFRGKYAGIGDLYDPIEDKFVIDEAWQIAELARLEELKNSQNQEEVTE
jgi:hypothetical protein